MLNSVIPSASQAQSLLTPAPTDQSVGILNHLFGIPNGNWHSLYYQSLGGTGNGSLLFTLLKDFDLVVLAFVTIMVLITMGIGAASTAHEGKTMGSRYHTLWTPIRSAFAMVLLAPIPGVGLSLIQGALLLMIWFSIGGANYLATQATAYMVKQGGSISGLSVAGGTKLAKQILQSEITSQYFVNFETPTGAASKFPLDSNPVWTPGTPETGAYGFWTYTFNSPPSSGLPQGDLGSITIPCLSQGGPMCTARKDAVSQMISTEYAYAQKLVNASQAAAGSSSIALNNKSATAPPPLTDTAITQAAQTYDAAEAAAVPQEVALSNPSLQKSLTTLNQNVQHFGWFSLGTFYWDIAAVNEKVQSRIDKATRWSGYDTPAIVKALGKTDTKGLTAVLSQATATIRATQPVAKSQKANTLLKKVFSSEGAWYAEGPASLLLAGDPIANLQRVGDWIVNGEIPAAITGIAVARVAAGAAKRSPGGLLEDLPLVGSVAGLGTSIVKAITPYVFALVLGLFVVGALWAYYLPSVPFILWTMGLIGWLIFLVEALVGSVIWAAGIALPEGEGIFGPRGDQGVMLFLNVMFRPALMVIGFFASFVLMGVVGNWVGASVSVFMGSMNGAMSWDPITWVATAVIVSIIALTITHKIFGLITWIPENVMRWVGGQGVQLGEQQAEGQARQTFVAAVGGATQKRTSAQASKGNNATKGKGNSDGADAGADAGDGGQKVPKAGGDNNMVSGGGTKMDNETPPDPKE